MVVANRQEIGPCKVELNVEVPPNEVEAAMAQAYHDLGEHVNVPGFRKGKAPLNLLRKYVSEERARAYARDEIVINATLVALKESNIEDVYDTPAVSDGEFADDGKFIFKATVPLAPKVELGQYKGLQVTREAPVVTDEQVQGRLEELRKMHAEMVTVEPRPLARDDIALLDVQQEGVDDEPRRARVKVGDSDPEFDEGITGMSPGEERVVEVTYPADHPNESLAGTVTKLHAKLIEVQERRLPDPNDDFAKKAGNFGSIEELRQDIRRSMEKSAEEIADRQMEMRLMEEIAKRSTISFPDIIKERTVAERLQELLAELKKHDLTLEQYLEETDRRMEEVTTGFEEASERDIRIGFALGEIAERESIKLEDEDIDAELEQMATDRGVPKESLKAYLDKTEGMRELRNRILQRKILDFLVHASNIKNVVVKGDTRR